MDQEMDSDAERQKPKPKTKTAAFRRSQTSGVGFDSHRPLQLLPQHLLYRFHCVP